MKRREFLALSAASLAYAQTPDPIAIFSCPMDPDVRQHDPGTCPRCGMTLAAGLPEPVEYHLDLATAPRALKPGQPLDLSFAVTDPWKNRPVTKFQLVHERLFHMFVVSQDLEFFLHDHPTLSADGQFHYKNLVLPTPGMYRILGDFYPDAATPQLIAKTLIVPGAPPPAAPARHFPGPTRKRMRYARRIARAVIDTRATRCAPLSGMCASCRRNNCKRT